MRVLTALIGLLVAAPLALADPPKLVIPPDPKPVSGYVRFTPDTTAKSIVYVSLDEAYPFPSEELKDGRRFILPVTGLKAGKYRFVAVGTLNDEQTATPFTVTIGDGGPAPPPTKPDDPTDPPVTGGKLFAVVIRSKGPVAPDVAAAVKLPAWDDARKAGHQMKDYPLDELPGNITAPNSLPAVVLLRVSADGKSSSVVKTVPLPTTNDAVKELFK